MIIGPEHTQAQLAASLAFADSSLLPARIRMYDEPGVVAGAAPTTAPLVEIVLARPCGALVAGLLVLTPQEVTGSMVLRTGIPRAARFVNGDDLLVAAGTVTDFDHDGDFTVEGGTTADGDDSPQLFAGGLALLGDVVFA